MTSIPQCFMNCKYFKDNICVCEKYDKIPEKIKEGTNICQFYKKINKIDN